MGLLILAAMRTEEQAMALIPVAMIAQLLFGGALVTVQAMQSPMPAFSTVIFSRWAFAGAGTSVDMNGRIEADKTFREISQYGDSFFDVSLIATYLTLLLFTALFVEAAISCFDAVADNRARADRPETRSRAESAASECGALMDD